MQALPMILQIAGAAFSAISAIRQGNAESAADKYNAQVATNNASMASAQAAADESKQRRDARIAIGSQRAAYGASGLSIEGSPLDVLEQSAATAELDALNIRTEGRNKAIAYGNQATLDLSAAKNAKSAGLWKAAGNLVSGATSAFGSASDAMKRTG